MTKTTMTVVAMSACLALPVRAQDVALDQSLSLSQAIAMALAREPSVRAVRAEVDVARGMKAQAGLRPGPMVSFEHRREPGGHDTATETGIEWPVDFRRSARIATADAEIRVAELEEADARRQLAADVAAAYGDVAAATRELAISDEVLAAANGQLDLLRARAAQGAVRPLDRDMVDVDVRRLQAVRTTQVGRVDMALLRLKRLLGMPSDTAVRITETLEDLVASDGPAGGQPATAKPDVQAAEARIAAANARISEVRSEARPEVTVFGSYMRMNSGFPQRGFSPAGVMEPIRGQFNYVSGGAMVTLPLWNRQQGNAAAATAARQAAEARADAARLTAAAEVSQAQARYEQARRAVTLYQDGVRPLARRNLDTLRETHQLGRATVSDVLAEQRRYLETERAYTLALNEAYAARVSLGRAIGELR